MKLDVLGLGHANFNESRMSSLVYHSHNEISDCEREAFMEVNKWKLIENSLPKINKIKINSLLFTNVSAKLKAG